jgi:hypothetical protein
VIILLKRLRRYLGTKPCADCGAQFKWAHLFKDPRRSANTTRTVCYQCIAESVRRTGDHVSVQGVINVGR